MSGNNDFSVHAVNLTYTETGKDGKQKTITRTIHVQKGLQIKFEGRTKQEKGTYYVGDDGKVRNEKGDIVGAISTTKEQIAALEGMANRYDEAVESLQKGGKSSFVLSEYDFLNWDHNELIVAKMVNERVDALKGNKYVDEGGKEVYFAGQMHESVPAVFRTTHHRTDSYLVELSDDKNNESRIIVNNRNKEIANEEGYKNRKKAWEEEHYIRHFFGQEYPGD